MYSTYNNCTVSNCTAKATFEAMAVTYSYLTPDLWPDRKLTKAPFQEFTDHLAKNHQMPQMPTKKPPY